jgi:hypothetical protein
MNPFEQPIPESIGIGAFYSGIPSSGNFIGVKVGDVNVSALPNFTDAQPDDRLQPLFALSCVDQMLEAGQETIVRFRADDALAGCQFTLSPDGLDILELLPNSAVTSENVGFFDREVTLSWEKGGNLDFALRVRAERAGKLSELLQLSSSITRNEAYTNDLKIGKMALNFGNSEHLRLLQVLPNPFQNEFQISYAVATAGKGTLSILDAQGKIIWSQNAQYEAGLHQQTIGKDVIASPGLYTIVFETAQGRSHCKAIKTDF